MADPITHQDFLCYLSGVVAMLVQSSEQHARLERLPEQCAIWHNNLLKTIHVSCQESTPDLVSQATPLNLREKGGLVTMRTESCSRGIQ